MQLGFAPEGATGNRRPPATVVGETNLEDEIMKLRYGVAGAVLILALAVGIAIAIGGGEAG